MIFGSKRAKRRIVFLLSALLLCLGAAGCGRKDNQDKKEIKYSICDETQIPDELRNIIEEKKANVFKLSYVNNDAMYIAIGYGAHNRQNLSVIVEDIYKTDNSIYVETNLYTKEELDESEQATGSDSIGAGTPSMYPYIVIKCDKYDLPVVFDVD